MPSVSLHQLRLSSYQFERNAKNGQATEEQETGDAKCHTQQRWSEQPASSPCKLQPAGRGRALLRYDDDDEQASGFQKSGQAFGGSSRCSWWSTSGQCAHHDGTGKFPLALVRRRMGWSAGLGGGFLSKKTPCAFGSEPRLRLLFGSWRRRSVLPHAPQVGGSCLDNLHSPGSPR